MSDILLSTPSIIGTPEQGEKSSTQTLDSLLQKGGFRVTPDELSNIDIAVQWNPSLLESIRKDIVTVQMNPIEKSRFDTMYIKGSGVLTIDGKNMSFIEFLTKYPEQKERSTILGKMDRPTKNAFRDWEVSMKKNESSNIDTALNQVTGSVDEKKEALNQKILEDKTVDVALNQKKEELDVYVQRAKELMDPDGLAQFDTLRQAELQQIQSDPAGSPIAQDLIKQWSTIEDIQGGRLNSTIEAYIISNNKEALTPKDPKKAKEFSGVVREMWYITWVKPTPENIDAFAASKVLGTNRENIVSNMHQIGSSGKYDRMTWDGESRSVIFHGESGTRILDTASIPPRERIMRNGLSISRDITPVIETPEQKEQKTIEKSIQNQTKWLKENPYIWALLWAEYNELFAQAEKSENPKEQLNYSYQWLQGKFNAINKLIDQYEWSWEQAESSAMKHALIQVESQIKQVIALATSYDALLKKKTNSSNNSDDNFDGTARDNLSWLVENRFDRMWPNANNALQQIIKSINKKNPDTTIDLIKPMEQRDHERLKKALEKLWGTADVLTSGDKLPVFQKNINMAISKNPDDSNSIEGLLKKTETPTPSLV